MILEIQSLNPKMIGHNFMFMLKQTTRLSQLGTLSLVALVGHDLYAQVPMIP